MKKALILLLLLAAFLAGCGAEKEEEKEEITDMGYTQISQEEAKEVMTRKS